MIISPSPLPTAIVCAGESDTMCKQSEREKSGLVSHSMRYGESPVIRGKSEKLEKLLTYSIHLCAVGDHYQASDCIFSTVIYSRRYGESPVIRSSPLLKVAHLSLVNPLGDTIDNLKSAEIKLTRKLTCPQRNHNPFTHSS